MSHHRCFELPRNWPTPPFGIALVEPKIPPNTGAIARLCAATNSTLHLIEPLGFKITDRNLKRAGLDYWHSVKLRRHKSLREFLETHASTRKFFFSTGGRKTYTEISYQPGDMLVFGSETTGLPSNLIERERERVYGIPMRTDNVRSLNLAMSTSIVLYEALRQVG
jgi:tRNA (cytidine/uridine-2'-O-)-methyltransferase